MKKYIIIFLVFNFSLVAVTFLSAASKDLSNEKTEQKQIVQPSDTSLAIKYIAAAIAITGATTASGIAIGRIGSAAMGAVSERPEAGGTAMILAALAEGVCLWGIAGAFLILFF